MISLQNYLNESLITDQSLLDGQSQIDEGLKDILKKLAMTTVVAAALINPAKAQIEKMNVDSEYLNKISSVYKTNYENEHNDKCDVVCGLPCDKSTDAWSSCLVSLWTLINGDSKYSSSDLYSMGDKLIMNGCIKDIRNVQTSDGKFVTMFAIKKGIAKSNIDQQDLAQLSVDNETIKSQDNDYKEKSKFDNVKSKVLADYKEKTGKDGEAFIGKSYEKQSAYDYAELELRAAHARNHGAKSGAVTNFNMNSKVKDVRIFHNDKNGVYTVVLIVDKGSI